MKYNYNINKLKLFGYHGLFDEEKNKGQFFYINISYKHKYKSNIQDNIGNVIDYSNICKDVESIFNAKRYNLLESLAKDIKMYLNGKYENSVFKIQIIKSSEYLEFDLDNISVEI